MTEKRFKLAYVCGDFGLIDNGDDVWIDLHSMSENSEKNVQICINKMNTLADENEQLKQSSTMYYNLFKELQRQMQGVKTIYDLDSKDFEDLIELSKGNVFDDEIGWIHLPIKELKE